MKRMVTAVLGAVAVAAAACDDPGTPPRILTSAIAADTGTDTTGGGQRGLTVVPSTSTVAVGDSAGFTAIVRGAQGDVVTRARVRWTVEDQTVARIEQQFGQSIILRALRPGTTLISAESRGSTGTAQLVVTDSTPPPPPPGDSVATVSVSPDTAVAAVGDTISYFATLRDVQGNILSGRVVTWSVSDSTVARVEAASGPSAVIRALAAGSTLVTATSEGKSGSGSLLVR